jgi:hypothetical protein
MKFDSLNTHLGATTLSIITLRITPFSITTNNITIKMER